MLTIHYDTVKKRPTARGQTQIMPTPFAKLGQYEEAIKYGEKAIELGRKGREADALAQNAITIALMKLGKTDEAVERGEEFLKERGGDVEASHLPNLCLERGHGLHCRKEARRGLQVGARSPQLRAAYR